MDVCVIFTDKTNAVMERENVFYIKNMVCNRCILVVTRLLEKAGFTPLDVGLGTAVVQEKPGREQREAFRKLLEAYGFELIDDSRMRLIEQIRTAVIELVHYSEDASKVNLSDYLRERCHRDYSALSKLFSEVNGISIEKYFLAQRIERVKELLKQVGLVKARYKKMKTLSGGMKRRAGIAQAMLNDPKILILDEPTAGLDPSERIRFRNLISELSEDRIVLLSTHIVSDIEYIAGDILLMKDGSLAISGTAEELIDSMPEPVWSCTVPKSRIDACLKAYKVANVKTIPGGAELRIVSKGRPAEDAVRVEPTLEDVFLCYFGERTGDSDGTV